MLLANTVQEKLAVQGVSKTYGNVTALDRIDLSVASGEFLTLLGPSGSGKTTLLQIVCGLTQPTTGRLVIDGRDCTDTPAHLRGIGVIFQSYALFPHMSVRENVAFPLEMRKLDTGSIKTKVESALEMVGLADLSHRLPTELSGGQQQRVALARCIVYEPALILMDEPLGALDRKLRETMQIEIKRLHRDTGATIIFVTHDQEEALALSDRICLMNNATIAQIGAPREIYGRPSSVFVADFIGISNLLSGRIETNGKFVCAEGSFVPPPGANIASGNNATLIVRPEWIIVGPETGASVAGNVIEVVYAGFETKLLVRLDHGTILTVRQTADETPVQLGDRVGLSWRPEHAQLLAE
jgi:putative spermidine/putrescine transport system ATP-binding protein